MEKIKFVMTDTDTQVSAVCRRALEAKGIAVTVCEKNGTKALETLLAVHPQAVLLDAFMPDLDAITVKQRYESAEVLLHENDRHTPPCTEVTVLCKAKARAKAGEYLNGVVTRELDGGDCEMLLYVVEREHLWFGTLLSLGDDIEVLSPVYLRRRIAAAAKKITALYGNGDNTLS